MKKKVLITGGSGFIGRNLVESLGTAFEVRAPTRRELDLLDSQSVCNFFRAYQADVLIQSATTPGHRNASSTLPVLESNLRMFFNLMSCRRKFGQLIHLGSGSEYDLSHYIPKMQESYFGQHIPIDPGGLSKYTISRFLETDVNTVQLRLFGVFGKYEDYEIRFISNAICKALMGKPITIKQNRRFDYLFIDDLAPVIQYFIEHKPRYKVYNITPDEAIELKSLALLIRKAVDLPQLPIEIAMDGMGVEYSGDNHRWREEMPAFELTSFESSIKMMVEWYEAHRSEIRKDALLVDK